MFLPKLSSFSHHRLFYPSPYLPCLKSCASSASSSPHPLVPCTKSAPEVPLLLPPLPAGAVPKVYASPHLRIHLGKLHGSGASPRGPSRHRVGDRAWQCHAYMARERHPPSTLLWLPPLSSLAVMASGSHKTCRCKVWPCWTPRILC